MKVRIVIPVIDGSRRYLVQVDDEDWDDGPDVLSYIFEPFDPADAAHLTRRSHKKKRA